MLNWKHSDCCNRIICRMNEDWGACVISDFKSVNLLYRCVYALTWRTRQHEQQQQPQQQWMCTCGTHGNFWEWQATAAKHKRCLQRTEPNTCYIVDVDMCIKNETRITISIERYACVWWFLYIDCNHDCAGIGSETELFFHFISQPLWHRQRRRRQQQTTMVKCFTKPYRSITAAASPSPLCV